MKRLMTLVLAFLPALAAADGIRPYFPPVQFRQMTPVQAAQRSPVRLTLRPATYFDIVTAAGVVTAGSGGGGSFTGGIVPNAVEFDSTVKFGGATSAFPVCLWNTVQTVDSFTCGLGTTSRGFVIHEAGDEGFDFAHAQATNPTFFIHSAAQSTTQWLGLTHNGTNASILTGAGSIALGTAAVNYSVTTSTDFRVGSAFMIGFSSNSNPDIAASDSLFRRGGAAATIQMGTDANGAPVNQTFRAHHGITGSNIVGASLTLAGGLGTGAAASNPLTLNRVVTKATGTTAQTYAPGTIICPTKILSNTSATAQTIATITTTTTSGGIVTMDYGNVACSASTCDADSGIVKVAWNNNAGTVAAAMTAVVLQSDSDATGTLAATPTATVATSVVSIKLTPTWVTIVPTSVVSYATFTIHSAADTIACQ